MNGTATQMDLLVFVITGGGACLAFIIGMWWKVEARQNTKIDKLHDEMHRQHLVIRDKLESIWQHLHIVKEEVKNANNR